MPLLTPLITHRPNATQLYASAGSGGGSSSTAPQFTATGADVAGGFISTGEGANVQVTNGYFVSNVSTDSIPDGAQVVVMANSAGLNRWNIGFSNSESGGNAGADFAIDNCNDAGAIVGTPLSINRLTGVVTATGLLPTQSNFLISLSSAVQNGTQPAGLTIVPMGSFTVAKTGLYLLSAQTQVNVGIGAGNDIVVGVSDFCAVGLTTSPATPGLASASTTTVAPFSMTYTDNTPGGEDYTITATNALVLTAGVNYIMQASVYSGITGTLRFPTLVGQTGVQFVGRIMSLCG